MILSRFLKIYPAGDHTGHPLYFSTKRAALALVPEATHALLSTGELKRLAPTELNALAGLGLVVSDLASEHREVCDFLAEVNQQNTILRLAVVLGLACNFACSYCYEGKLKGAARMSAAVAKAFIGFVKSRFTEEITDLVLDFYGGEPLLYTDLIKYLAAELRPFAEDRGARFRFTLVTNGSLLTGAMADELKHFGLDGAKVTVDGPAANHNRYRPFKSGQPSFNDVLANLRESCKIVRIAVHGNYTNENHHLFPALLDHLQDQGLGPDRLDQVTFQPAIRITDPVVGLEFTAGCASINEPWLVEASLFLREAILAHGFRTPKISPSPCMVDLTKAFTVHCDGTLYKCVGLVGHAEFACGDVANGPQEYDRIYHLDHWREQEACRQCEYLPLCFGGCRFMQYQRTGSLAGVDCLQKFLDASLEPMLRQDIKYPQQHSSRM